MHPRYSDRMYQQEEVKTANPHPIMTGISSVVIFLGIIAFAGLAIASAGCSSPPDNCAEVDKCDNGDVDGSADQPDSNTSNCSTNGTCPDAATTTVDAPQATGCAANQWMEDPPMFNCNNMSTNTGSTCDPLLIEGSNGCEIRCVGSFWATPEQLMIHETERYFDYVNVESEITIRCTQRVP